MTRDLYFKGGEGLPGGDGKAVGDFGGDQVLTGGGEFKVSYRPVFLKGVGNIPNSSRKWRLKYLGLLNPTS